METYETCVGCLTRTEETITLIKVIIMINRSEGMVNTFVDIRRYNKTPYSLERTSQGIRFTASEFMLISEAIYSLDYFESEEEERKVKVNNYLGVVAISIVDHGCETFLMFTELEYFGYKMEYFDIVDYINDCAHFTDRDLLKQSMKVKAFIEDLLETYREELKIKAEKEVEAEEE